MNFIDIFKGIQILWLNLIQQDFIVYAIGCLIFITLLYFIWSLFKW